MKEKIKYLKKKLNIPLIIFVLIVGSLLLVAKLKNRPVDQAKQTVDETVNQLTKKLNEAAIKGHDTSS